MYKNNKIAVVIPAYNEELLLQKTIDSVPNYIDKVVIIDDFSKDKTKSIIKNNYKKKPDTIVPIYHLKNIGAGGALSSGYKWCKKTK